MPLITKLLIILLIVLIIGRILKKHVIVRVEEMPFGFDLPEKPPQISFEDEEIELVEISADLDSADGKKYIECIDSPICQLGKSSEVDINMQCAELIDETERCSASGDGIHIVFLDRDNETFLVPLSLMTCIMAGNRKLAKKLICIIRKYPDYSVLIGNLEDKQNKNSVSADC